MSSHTHASQRLHSLLVDLISSTPPGERLPSEPQLAHDLGVSRATLREAMRSFETQGMIRRRQGSGTYVIHPSYVIESGLEVLESIETLAERIGLKVTMGEFKIDHRPPTEEEANALEVSLNIKIVHLARVITAEGRPVAYLIDVVPEEILNPTELQMGFSGSVLDLFLSRGEPSLLSSRCEISAIPASPDVARALGIQRGDVLLFFEAYLFDVSGRVIDYSFSYFLPGVFRFHVVRRVSSR